MAYDDVGIVNLGLLQIGALPIVALTENSPNAIKVNQVWQYLRDEVLQARDWKFAVSRVALAKNATDPLYGYDYAYTMPSGFLRLKKWKNSYNLQTVYDPPVYPIGYPYVIQALPDGTLCLFINYDNTDNPLYISYIKRETNAARYSPTFISALSFRVAAALAIPITESPQKFQAMTSLYQAALHSAGAVNESFDFIEDETGSDSWVKAGR